MNTKENSGIILITCIILAIIVFLFCKVTEAADVSIQHKVYYGTDANGNLNGNITGGIEVSPDIIKAIKKAMELIRPDDGITLAIYHSPAQRLRNEADKLEQEELDKQFVNEVFTEFLREYE